MIAFFLYFSWMEKSRPKEVKELPLCFPPYKQSLVRCRNSLSIFRGKENFKVVLQCKKQDWICTLPIYLFGVTLKLQTLKELCKQIGSSSHRGQNVVKSTVLNKIGDSLQFVSFILLKRDGSKQKHKSFSSKA